MIYRVNYSYAAPNGALRSSSNILDANSPEEAMTTVRQLLSGKLRFLKVNSATEYQPDQAELPLTKKK